MNDPPASGAWNMAVDEALLESLRPDEACVLRLYGWTPATLSLGYFQRHVDRQLHLASAACPLVRRPTGGGAILHDREWTYSLVAPAGHPVARNAAEMYHVVHGALIQSLEQFGARAMICMDPARRRRGDEPFMCFHRRAPGDVLLGNSKIAGSAQRSRRGSLLQHGSILLEDSPFAPELPGIMDLATGVHFDSLRQGWDSLRQGWDNLRQGWLNLLVHDLHLELFHSTLSEQERALAQEFHASRFDCPKWNEMR